MHRDAPRCTEMHRVPPSWLYVFWMHRVAPSYTSYLHCDASTSYLHGDAPRCTVMHRVAPSYYILYYLGKVITIMRFCFLVHHGALRCITVHFSMYPFILCHRTIHRLGRDERYKISNLRKKIINFTLWKNTWTLKYYQYFLVKKKGVQLFRVAFFRSDFLQIHTLVDIHYRPNIFGRQ